MIPVSGLPILTAAAMREAEAAAMTGGVDVWTLMERAGRAIAASVARLAADGDILIVCGPGNNGGDGYVAATNLRAGGRNVRVGSLAHPATDAARRARAAWGGPVEALGEAGPAPVVVDALFGTGLSRPLADEARVALIRLIGAARLTIAVDLPSGVDTDTGAVLGEAPRVDVTLALGAVKPAHVLHPAAARCGAVRVLDIGVAAHGERCVLARPDLPPPGPADHKYTRGMVAIAAGGMAGAAELAAEAAMRAGAGYVELLGGAGTGAPHALVRRELADETLADPRIGALLVGPGLGRDDDARATLAKALASDHQLVIDGDALHILDLDRLCERGRPAILTPHAGEFKALFGDAPGSKIDRAIAGAARAGAVVVFKGPDTVIADHAGRVRCALTGSPWLSTAGTGDVLAGTIAAMLAAGQTPFDAAGAGVWLHADAARRAGAAFIADDLARCLTAARAGI